MNTVLTLTDLTARTGVDVFDYLERDVAIPVTDRPQAQGDLLVIPYELIASETPLDERASQQPVGTAGIELLRTFDGGNPHTLVREAHAGNCTWTWLYGASTDLALGLLDTDVVAYLIHPEHGAAGISPGRYVIRRQRELAPFGLAEWVAD